MIQREVPKYRAAFVECTTLLRRRLAEEQTKLSCYVTEGSVNRQPTVTTTQANISLLLRALVEVTATKRVWIAAAVTTVLVAVVGAVWLRRPLSPHEIAEKYRNCVLESDAACIISVSSPVDKGDNRITAESLQVFLATYIKPYFKDPSPADFDATGEPERSLIFSGPIQTTKGPIDYSVQVGPTDDGYRVFDGFSSLVLLAAALPKGTDLPSGSKRLRYLATQIQALQPELTRLGFVGLRPKAGGRLQSWAELTVDLSTRATRAEQIEAELRGTREGANPR